VDGVLFFSPPALPRWPLAWLARAFSPWRLAACALLAFFTPLLAAPRPPLLRALSLSDFGVDFMGSSRKQCLAARACQASRHFHVPGTCPGAGHLLLLRERLLELELRLLPLALGLLLLLRLELLRLLLLPPLEAVPRLLLLRDDDGLDFEEEEELRDAIACSFGRLIPRPSLF
jgi:hypothetical protein